MLLNNRAKDGLLIIFKISFLLVGLNILVTSFLVIIKKELNTNNLKSDINLVVDMHQDN